MGKILTVWSPLAGAGKSILSIAISKILSGRLKDAGRVVIVDLDIFAPMTKTYLYSENNNDILTVCDLITQTYDPEQFSSYISAGKSNISKNLGYIKGVINPLNKKLFKQDDLEKLVSYLSQYYDYVVCDIHSYINNSATIAALKHADVVIPVFTAEVACFRQFDAVSDMFVETIRNDAVIVPVLNKVVGKLSIGVSEAEKYTGYKGIYKLPYCNKKITLSIQKGGLINEIFDIKSFIKPIKNIVSDHILCEKEGVKR